MNEGSQEAQSAPVAASQDAQSNATVGVSIAGASSDGAAAGNSLGGPEGIVGKPVDANELKAAREAYLAERRAEERLQHRTQVSALIMASVVAASPDASVAVLADKAVTAAEALLDRLDR
jgi:uncharacterized protein (DUF342 family)